MNSAVFCLQLASAAVALAAAGLWFWSAFVDIPPMTYEGIERLKSALDMQARRNKASAIVTGIAILLGAAATICGGFK
jgi:hypothetical protein